MSETGGGAHGSVVAKAMTDKVTRATCISRVAECHSAKLSPPASVSLFHHPPFAGANDEKVGFIGDR
jgi:hypothetical protein